MEGYDSVIIDLATIIVAACLIDQLSITHSSNIAMISNADSK